MTVTLPMSHDLMSRDCHMTTVNAELHCRHHTETSKEEERICHGDSVAL